MHVWQAFHASLRTFPRSGWALYGLFDAYTDRNEPSAAEAWASQLHAAWVHADVELRSACPQFESHDHAPVHLSSNGLSNAPATRGACGWLGLGFVLGVCTALTSTRFRKFCCLRQAWSAHTGQQRVHARMHDTGIAIA